MALSGEFQKFPIDNFGLYCSWSATQSVTGNYSNITLKVYLKYYNLDVGERTDSKISINGTTETYTAPAIDDYTDGYKLKLLKTKTVKVNHNSNGTKEDVSLSASWRFDGTYKGVSIGTITASASVNLNSIDRTAPTVKHTVSDITASGLKISATSSATADIWQYSLDGGTNWTQFSTTAGTSASKTLTGLTPNTSYKVRVRARKKSNQVYGSSTSSTVKTLGGTVVNSVNVVTADASSVSVVLNATVYDASYTNTLVIKNGSTTILTISGLSWSKGTANRTVTLTSAQRTTLLNAMSSVKSFTGTFAVSTYSGSTQIGSTSSKTTKVSTTSSSAPTLSGFTYADTNTTTTGITGNDQVFVQSYSTLTVTPGTATAKNGASIANYTATCNGVSKSNTSGAALTVGAIAKSGTISVVLTVTDSRGYTASVTKNITVVAYSKPKLSSITLRRTNEIEAEMQLEFSGSFSPITVSSTQKNSLVYMRYRYKKTNESSYGSYTGLLASATVSGTSFSFSNLELCSLDANSSYDFHLMIRDKIGSASSLDLYFVIPQGTPLLALRKGKVGVNTPNPTEALHVVGNGLFSGTLTAATLNGALAPSKLSSAVPISKGGTGATTVAAAQTNLSILPRTGGTLTGQIAKGDTASRWINARTTAPLKTTVNASSSSFYPIVSAKTVNGTWDIGALGETLYFSYATDANFEAETNETTKSGINAAGNFTGKAANVTGTVAVANGGTGATTATSARSKLGIKCTSLYSGTLTTGSATFTYGSHKAYLILGQVSSGSARVALLVPAGQITTSAVPYQLADESYYYSFNLSYADTTATIAYRSRNDTGQVLRIWGIN